MVIVTTGARRAHAGSEPPESLGNAEDVRAMAAHSCFSTCDSHCSATW